MDPRALREALSLADPAGELPLDWIELYGTAYRLLDGLGSVRLVFEAEGLVKCAWAEGGGRASARWSWTVPAFGGVEEEHEFDHSALWRALVARGLPIADARRQFVRVLLFAYGIPHRLRWDEGEAGVDVWGGVLGECSISRHLQRTSGNRRSASRAGSGGPSGNQRERSAEFFVRGRWHRHE